MSGLDLALGVKGRSGLGVRGRYTYNIIPYPPPKRPTLYQNHQHFLKKCAETIHLQTRYTEYGGTPYLLEVRLVLGGADHPDVRAGNVVVRFSGYEDDSLNGRVVGDLSQPDVLDLLPELARNGVHLLRPVDSEVIEGKRGRVFSWC